MASSGLGSDVSGNLSITINTWKLPDISSLHNVSRTGIHLIIETMQTYFLQGYPTHSFGTPTKQSFARPKAVAGRPAPQFQKWWS
jgi:hypothetical protein